MQHELQNYVILQSHFTLYCKRNFTLLQHVIFLAKIKVGLEKKNYKLNPIRYNFAINLGFH